MPATPGEPDAFAPARSGFDEMVCWLEGTESAALSHAELEDQVERRGRELQRLMLQDHLDLRALREQRVRPVDATGVVHANVETGHSRQLGPGRRLSRRGAIHVTRVVYALGLNLVVITLRVNPPWGGCPIALPINVRLHRKGDKTTTLGHAADMMRELAGWLPERAFHLCADGAYASLAGAGLPRTHVTSRMRRDAALYEAAPPPTGRRGRPRTKGARLPTPPELAVHRYADQPRSRCWGGIAIAVAVVSVAPRSRRRRPVRLLSGPGVDDQVELVRVDRHHRPADRRVARGDPQPGGRRDPGTDAPEDLLG